MPTKMEKHDLNNQWMIFWDVARNPWTVFSLIATLIIFIFYKSMNPIFPSIWTSIVGGIIATLWLQATQKTELKTRAEMALRNLTTLYNIIDSSQARVGAHIDLTRNMSDADYQLHFSILMK